MPFDKITIILIKSIKFYIKLMLYTPVLLQYRFVIDLSCNIQMSKYCNFLAIRDLKPDNIMTKEDGTPVVMDLGSAAPSRVEIKTAREATQLQVGCCFIRSSF